ADAMAAALGQRSAPGRATLCLLSREPAKDDGQTQKDNYRRKREGHEGASPVDPWVDDTEVWVCRRDPNHDFSALAKRHHETFSVWMRASCQKHEHDAVSDVLRAVEVVDVPYDRNVGRAPVSPLFKARLDDSGPDLRPAHALPCVLQMDQRSPKQH